VARTRSPANAFRGGAPTAAGATGHEPGEHHLRAAPPTPPASMGARLAADNGPHEGLQIADCRLQIGLASIYNLQSTIYNLNVGWNHEACLRPDLRGGGFLVLWWDALRRGVQ